MSTEGETPPVVEPIAPEAVAPAAEPAVEPVKADDDTSADETLQDDKTRGKNAEARIAELTRARRSAERERDYYKGLATPSAPNSSQDAVEPTPDKFEDYGDYVKALAKHTVATEQAARASQAQTQMREAEFTSKLDTARSTIADYADVVDKSDIMVADHVRDALVEAEKSGELLYHLAKHPEIVDKLNTMSALKAATELGRLEATLAAPAAPRPSNAPAPAGTLKTTGSAVPVDLGNADMDTYIAERRKQGAKY